MAGSKKIGRQRICTWLEGGEERNEVGFWGRKGKKERQRRAYISEQQKVKRITEKGEKNCGLIKSRNKGGRRKVHKSARKRQTTVNTPQGKMAREGLSTGKKGKSKNGLEERNSIRHETLGEENP